MADENPQESAEVDAAAEAKKFKVFIAEADRVIAARGGNLAKLFEGMVGSSFGWIDGSDSETFGFFDRHDGEAGSVAPRPSRWQANVADGVLTVSAWRDDQDRDDEAPGTVLVLAPGAWRSFTGHVTHLDDEDLEDSPS